MAPTPLPQPAGRPKQLLVPAKSVEAVMGWSPMTLNRMVDERRLGFPAPVYIGRKRFWVADELEAWTKTLPRQPIGQSEETPAPAPVAASEDLD